MPTAPETQTEAAAPEHPAPRLATVQARRQPGTLSPRTALIAALAFVATAIVIYAPILGPMILQWYRSDDYSHGFLIVPMAVFFGWQERHRLKNIPIRPSWLGIAPLVLSTFTLGVGRLGVELMNMRVSFVFAIIGLVLLTLGRSVFRVLWFPLLFLFLMVPLPQSIVNSISFPLQLVAADMAVNTLYHLGIPALREGNIIHLANSTLFVAEACSGLRSLMALITLGVVVGYLFKKSFGEWVLIVISAIPVAILVNAGRVALTGVLTHRLGQQAATGVIHQTEGMFTFGVAFVLLLTEALLVSKLWPRRTAAATQDAPEREREPRNPQ